MAARLERPLKAKPDETLIRALARAHRWNRMLEGGTCRSIAEIAGAEKIDRSFVSRLLDLTLLVPDIQEAIPEGWQPKGMQLKELMGGCRRSGGAAAACQWITQET